MVFAQQGPSLMELLGEAGYALDTPGAYLRGLMAFRPGERVSGKELLGIKEEGFSGAGLMAEMALDPLNLLTAGIPLAAVLGKGDKLADAARVAGSAEDVLAHNKMVDELLAAGVMPESLAAKTQFSKLAHRPKPGVSTEEVLDAYKQIMPDIGDYDLADEDLLELIQHQLSEPVHAAASTKVGSQLAGGGFTQGLTGAPARVSLEEDIDRLMEALSGGDPDAFRRSVSEARAAGEAGVTPLRLAPESEALARLFDQHKEIARAQHMTTASPEEVGGLQDLLTAGKNVEQELDVGGGSWGGSGVYVAPEPKTAAYLDVDNRRKVLGTAFTENPLVIPASEYYGPHGLQDFIRTNRHLFPNITDEQRMLANTAPEGLYAEIRAGLVDDAEDAVSHYSTLDVVKNDAIDDANYFMEEMEGTPEWALVDDWIEHEGLDLQDLVGAHAIEAGERALKNQDALSFESFLASRMEGRAPEGYELDKFIENPFSEVTAEMATKADQGALKSEDYIQHQMEGSRFTPERASDIARRQGYDSVVFSERNIDAKNWMDDLFETKEYEEFREAVLEDPDFWLEVNMLYPETAERYHGAADFVVPRHGDPGHGQLFNLGPHGEEFAPEKLVLPKASRRGVPGKDVQKAILAAIGVEGLNATLHSMQERREVSA